MSLSELKIVAEYGSLGVIILLLWIQWDERKRVTKLVSNHLEHETASRDEHTKVMTQLVEAIRSLQERFDRKI